MKMILMVLPLIMIFAIDTHAKTGWENYRLKGKVKEYIESNYIVKQMAGTNTNIFLNANRFCFDDKGNPIETLTFIPEGAPAFYTNKIEFTNNNKLCSNIFIYPLATYKSEYKYDDKGNLVEVDWYHLGKSLESKEENKYDNKGNLTEVNTFHADGSFESKSEYKYDDKNNLIEINNYLSKYGSSKFKVGFKYDENGKMVEQDSYTSSGALSTINIYKNTFDNKGNIIMIETTTSNTTDGGIIKSITKYKNDEKGNQIESTQYRFGNSGEYLLASYNYRHYIYYK